MDIKDVENLATLARIELQESEKKEILRDMKGILEYVKQIEKVPIEKVEQDFKHYNIWREDKMDAREFDPKLITGQFPDAQDGFLKVKKIL